MSESVDQMVGDDVFADPEPRAAWVRAVGAASTEIDGVLAKEARNDFANYSYVGHEHVLRATRAAMLNHGLVVGPAVMAKPPEQLQGKHLILLWTFSIPVYHSSGHVEYFDVMATTPANDKSAFIASTAADRTLRLRLFGIAGGRAENPEDNSHGGGVSL